jgi:hypothetical protein
VALVLLNHCSAASPALRRDECLSSERASAAVNLGTPYATGRRHKLLIGWEERRILAGGIFSTELDLQVESDLNLA